MLGLLLCEGFSLVVQSRGCSLVAICGLLVMVASLVVEHEAVGTGSVVVTQGPSCSVACGIFLHQGLSQHSLHCKAKS